MAQSGFTPILIYSSTTASQAPSASNLTNSTLGSELAINIVDGKLFYKDNANAVQVIGWKTTPTTAGGTGVTSYAGGDLLYYASGTALTKLGIGSANQILKSTGSTPAWETVSNLAVTSIAFGTTGLTPSAATQGAVTVAGTLVAANGGTGQSSYAVGDLLYASGTTTLSKLADVATGNALISGGVGVAPSWGKIGLTTHVSGTLPTANGGTNLTSFTANGIVYASSTSALATGSALTFNGTNLSTTGTATAQAFIPTSSTAPTVGLFLPASTVNGLRGNATIFSNTDYNYATVGGKKVTVGTSATTISYQSSDWATLCLINGLDGSGNFFADFVFNCTTGGPDVILSNSVSGAPAARTYTMSSGNLQLAMGSGSYTIYCQTINSL